MKTFTVALENCKESHLKYFTEKPSLLNLSIIFFPSLWIPFHPWNKLHVWDGINYFCKTVPSGCLAAPWIRLCPEYALNTPLPYRNIYTLPCWLVIFQCFFLYHLYNIYLTQNYQQQASWGSEINTEFDRKYKKSFLKRTRTKCMNQQWCSPFVEAV